MRWHSKIGLSIFLVVIFLAVSGVALNHSPQLNLSHIKLSNGWLLKWYGLKPATGQGFDFAGNWLYQAGDNQLFYNGQAVANCRPPLMSATQAQGLFAALCGDGLVLLTAEGQFIEVFNDIQGLPTHITQLASQHKRIFLLSDSEPLEFKVNNFSVEPIDKETVATANITLATSLPQQIAASINSPESGLGVSLETVVIDLHSGRFFGPLGVLFIDLVGLLLCVLALTGLWSWISRDRRNGR